MQERHKTILMLPPLDWLLLLVIVALLGASVYWALSSPALWAWCLGTFDVRAWTHWTWTGVVAALLLVLAAIRLRPETYQGGGRKGEGGGMQDTNRGVSGTGRPKAEAANDPSPQNADRQSLASAPGSPSTAKEAFR